MATPDSVLTLERDLRAIFTDRLQSLVSYRPANDNLSPLLPTLATIRTLTVDDLRACASHVDHWHDAGLATPLLLTAGEFARALDAFPLEFGAIIAEYTLIVGADPFTDLTIEAADARRACEVQARSHLLHLREGYIETRGRGDALAELVADSAAPLSGLVKSVARLLGQPTGDAREAASVVERAAGLPAGSLTSVTSRSSAIGGDEARRLFPQHLEAVERLTQFIDRWGRS